MTLLTGLLLGGISGGFTYALTADSGLALIVGAIVAALAWLGVAAFVAIDN